MWKAVLQNMPCSLSHVGKDMLEVTWWFPQFLVLWLIISVTLDIFSLWASVSSPKKWRISFLMRFLWGFNKHIYSKKITNMSEAFEDDISGYLKTCQFLCLPYQLCWQKISWSKKEIENFIWVILRIIILESP